jgi:hypothetical protein
VWKYDGSLHKTCGRWVNGKTTCYEIPISSCTQIKSLEEIKQPDIRKEVVRQQKEWLKSEVRNRDYSYKDTPDWMLDEVKINGG